MSEPDQIVSSPTTQQRVDVDIRSLLPAALAKRWHSDADAKTQHDVLQSLNTLLSTVATYMPRNLLNDLFQNTTRGQATGEFRYSTVLFVDISGFTAMSEQLNVLGREGAETLTGVVNDFFTTMSDISAHYGGDVVVFGGDAMLLLFDGIDHALRACHTAWHMQQTMAERFAKVETAQGNFQLRMAAGLGSGPIFAASLGTAESMHYALMGPAMISVGRAEALAGGGRILLDEATQLLAGDLTVEADGTSGFARLIAEPSVSYARPQPPQLDPAPLETREQIDWLARRIAVAVPFLPTGLLRRLRPNPSAALEGEHRPVTILFVDFRDADMLVETLGADDPNAITPRLNRAFNAVQAIVARYEGVINKIGAGSAGAHIIALFGALQSHEDDPERAIHAALEIREALQTTGLPGVHMPRVGINTGFVYAANVGSHARREYTVMGDEVNLAARLMTAAEPGQIIASASTALHAEDAFELEERAAVRLKGKAEAQRNFVIHGVRRQRSESIQAASGELLGRSQEMELAYEHIVAAASGRGQIIALKGEAGVGKSRLIDALTLKARADRFQVTRSACTSYSGDVPYSVWIDALRALMNMRPSDSDERRGEKLRAALLEIERSNDVPILGEIIGVTAHDSTWTATLDAQARQRRLFNTVVALLKHRAAQRPLLWVIDDAQWIDAASLDLLNYVATHIDAASIALLVGYRPRGAWADWQSATSAVEIVLTPFDRATAEMLIADVLHLEDRQLPLAVQTLMEHMATGVLNVGSSDATAFEQYWGNPFFALERTRALIDLGVLAKDETGHWRVTRSIESIEMPHTIHGVIMSRIDRLPEPARRVLQVAAVIGRAFDLNVLRALYDSPNESADALQSHLRELSDLGLSPLEDDADQTRYVFRNVTTQEVAYDSLRYERRRELHRRIGQFIEEHRALVDDPASLMTHHFFKGQLWEKVLEFAMEAGSSARQKYANAAAASAYRRALQAAEALSSSLEFERLTAHEALGDVLLIMGEYDETLRNYEQARELAASDARHHADLCRKTADAHEHRSEYDEAFAWLQRGLAHAASDSLESARIYLMGAAVFHRQGKNDQAREWCERSLEVSRALADDDARRAEGRALFLLAGISYRHGDLEQSIKAAQKAVDVYVLAGDAWGQSQALNTLANAYADQGDFASAIRFYSDSLQLKEQIGEVDGQATIMLNLGDLYRQRGELVAACQMFEQSLRIFRELRYTVAVALLKNNLAAVSIAERNWEEAASRLDESEKLFAEIGSDEFKAELQRHRAELSLGQGLIDEAVDWAQQAIMAAEQADEKLEAGLARRVLGEVYLVQNNLSTASRELQASLDVLEGVGSQVEAANTRLSLAQLRRLQNRSEEARHLIAAAIKTYEAVGAESLKTRAEAFVE